MAYDLEKLKKLKNQTENKNQTNKGDGIRRFPLPGDTREFKIRILPSPMNNGEAPGKPLFKHFGIPEKFALFCYKTYEKECKICNLISKYRNRIDFYPDKELKDLLTNNRAGFNILVIKAPEPNSKDKDTTKYNEMPNDVPYFMETPISVLNEIIDYIFNEEVGDVTDIQNGCTLTFQRVSDGKQFKITPARGSSPVSKDPAKLEEILSQRYNLDKIFSVDEKYDEIIDTAIPSIESLILSKIAKLEGKPTSREEFKHQTKTESKQVAKDEVTESKPKSKPGDPDCFGKYKEKISSGDDAQCSVCPREFECQDI
jgi:hypothetical protein